MENIEPRKTIVKDYTYQNFVEDDDHDFEIKGLRDETLIDPIPGLDDRHEFEEEMYNFGDEEDLPYSDRALDCQARGISYKKCFDK